MVLLNDSRLVEHSKTALLRKSLSHQRSLTALEELLQSVCCTHYKHRRASVQAVAAV